MTSGPGFKLMLPSFMQANWSYVPGERKCLKTAILLKFAMQTSK